MNQAQHSDSPRSEFGAYLRSQRQRCELTLSDIARITKIPQRSLECLEEGEFQTLPAEVFVRGFLRSYARCVGMDPEDTVARYRDVGKRGASGPAGEADDGETRHSRTGAEVPRASEHGRAGNRAYGGAARGNRDDRLGDSAGDEAADAVAGSTDGTRSWSHATGVFIARSLFERDADEEASRRGTVTLAVIILVILATLTTSYWLRRPSSSGSGVTDAGELLAPASTRRSA